MKKFLGVFLFSTIFLGIMGLVLAQDEPADDGEIEAARPITFELVNEIGRAVPRNMLYNAPLDQYLVVDAYNSLVLMDAPTFTTQHVIYDVGDYADFARRTDKVQAPWVAGYYASGSNRIVMYDDATGPTFARANQQVAELEKQADEARKQARSVDRSQAAR